MTEQEIIQGNLTIAEFLGARIYHTGFSDGFPSYTFDGFNGFKIRALTYHSDYRYLIPVVERIENQPNLDISIVIKKNKCRAYIDKSTPTEAAITNLFECDTKMESIYRCAVEAIAYIQQLTKK